MPDGYIDLLYGVLMRHNEARHQQHHILRLHLLEAWHKRLGLDSGLWKAASQEDGVLVGVPSRHDVGDVVFVH